MRPQPIISSTKNPRIVALRKLSRRKQRQVQNRFAVEGLQLLGMAVEAGHRPLEVFFCREHFSGDVAPRLLATLTDTGAAAYAVSPNVMQTLSERETPQGLIATFPPFSTPLIDLVSQAKPPVLLLVLDRLQDPGNLGTLIRTADAVGAAGLILLEPCVDPFDLKTVRGSMGSIFTVPQCAITDPDTLAAICKQTGVRLVGADGYQGQAPWDAEAAVLRGSVALALGNEARGLSPDLRPHLQDWVRLPILGHAESLNVAVAGGVLMYQWLQQNLV